MSKLQKHIDLLTVECNKVIAQLEQDDYTPNELINAHKRIIDMTNTVEALQRLQHVLAQQRSRIVAPPSGGLNGLKSHNH